MRQYMPHNSNAADRRLLHSRQRHAMTLVPYPYQSDAIDALHEHVCTKGTNPCVVIPTGGGKSPMIAWTIKRWRDTTPHVRIVVVAHRKELIEQNAAEAVGIMPDADIGIYSAALNRRDFDANILFASIDSVHKRGGEFAPFDVIMVDECHRIPPGGEGKYRKFITECRRFSPKLIVVGWTATPFRMNCGAICHKDHILNEVCYEARLSDLIDDGYLCGLRSKVGKSSPDLKGVRRNRGGDYIVKSLSGAANREEIVNAAVKEAVYHMNHEGRKSAVFFCVDVEHCNSVSRALMRNGVFAPVVTGKTGSKTRERAANDFRSGKLRAICNVNVYTEGFNAKRVDCIVLLRPTLSAGLYSQMVGRGLRVHESKSDCLVLDFGGCIEEHGPIDCLGDDRVQMAVCNACRESFSRATRVCPNCGWRIPRAIMERMEASDNERRLHAQRAAELEILSKCPNIHKVDDVYVSRCRRAGSPDSVLVQYRCGLSMYREWICLDHDGLHGNKAKSWWMRRFQPYDASNSRFSIPSVDKALEDMFLTRDLLAWTKTISVKKNGRYYDIVGYNEDTTSE